MISVGYCYGGDDGKAGYRQETVARDEKDAKLFIEQKLAGHTVNYVESGGKMRAYKDGVPTGYIYFTVSAETWAVIDLTKIGCPRSKSVLKTGSLQECKAFVKTSTEKEGREEARRSGLKYHGQRFWYNKTGDSIEIETGPVGGTGTITTRLQTVIVRVGK